MGYHNIIDLEQIWNHLHDGISKLKNILEGVLEQPLNANHYALLYTYHFEKISIPSLSYSFL